MGHLFSCRSFGLQRGVPCRSISITRLPNICALWTGFAHDETAVVAHASQYVDDATSSGTVKFLNNARSKRISSAHKLFDPRNLSELANHLAWIPFHFLPGNGGLIAGRDPGGSFIEKIVCRPDSPLAREMVTLALADRDKPYGLHRLGMTIHIHADTWADQGFAGVLHAINEVEDAEQAGGPEVFESALGGCSRSSPRNAARSATRCGSPPSPTAPSPSVPRACRSGAQAAFLEARGAGHQLRRADPQVSARVLAQRLEELPRRHPGAPVPAAPQRLSPLLHLRRIAAHPVGSRGASIAL